MEDLGRLRGGGFREQPTSFGGEFLLKRRRVVKRQGPPEEKRVR